MAIEYTRVNPAEVTTDVMKQRAMEAEERAFVTETEAARLHDILAILEPGAQRSEVESELRNQRLEADKRRKQAKRANGAAPLTEVERDEVRRGFLQKWIEAIESQHAEHTAVRNEQTRLLELSGKSSLEEDEKAEAEQEKKDREEALAQLEVGHALALSRLDALSGDGAENNGHGHLHAVEEPADA